VLSWMEELSFPDGYASNIPRCVNKAHCKVSCMKSLDCHVFMQRLLPIVFRPYLPKPLWESLTELSVFFRDIRATSFKCPTHGVATDEYLWNYLQTWKDFSSILLSLYGTLDSTFTLWGKSRRTCSISVDVSIWTVCFHVILFFILFHFFPN